MDSSVVSDPRFKLLGKRLGISWREALGTCFLVWLACYERRSERMTNIEVDVAAEVEGFAEHMVGVGLAHFTSGTATVIVHGVTERIKFLKRQKIRGAAGGRVSGESRRRKANASHTNEANASGSAQAYSPAPTPTPAPVPNTEGKGIAAPPPRPRDPLFDAIAEVTRSDPSIRSVAGHIAKVRKALAEAEPHYTAEDVREFGRRLGEFCSWAAEAGRPPTLGEVEKYIGQVRRPRAAGPSKNGAPDLRQRIVDEGTEFIRRGEAEHDAV